MLSVRWLNNRRSIVFEVKNVDYYSVPEHLAMTAYLIDLETSEILRTKTDERHKNRNITSTWL